MVQLIIDITPRDWFDYATALGPIIAAVIACGLALWQGMIQKRQHNFDLFKERWKLKKQLEEYIPELTNVSGENGNYGVIYHEISKIIDTCSYLFNEEIAQKAKTIADLYLKTSTLSRKNTHLIKTNQKVDNNALDQEICNMLKLSHELQHLMTMISSYLKKNNF